MEITDNPNPTTEAEKPVGALAETKAILEEIKKEKEELKTLLAQKAEDMLSGETGGHVEAPVIDEETQKKKDAAKFFEGTSLEKAIIPDVKN